MKEARGDSKNTLTADEREQGDRKDQEEARGLLGRAWTDVSVYWLSFGIRLNSPCFRVLQTKGLGSHQPDFLHLKK